MDARAVIIDPHVLLAKRYAEAITPAMEALIDAGDPDDPIARQFRPDLRELTTTPDERADPIEDFAFTPVPGIVHRHRDRCLLKLTHLCPVYCRFCFRREMIGPVNGPGLSPADLDAAFAYIESHPELWEVILTGGDPLILSARRVAEVTARLSAIAHLKVIRWHSRVPVVSPERIDDALLAALTATEKVVFVAVHANHPRELTPSACAALARLADAGVTLVSQSVLLRGVNDSVDTLEALMRAFVTARVKPYYLHHPDLAPGTSHFRLTTDEGLRLVAALRARVSGLCMPTYVVDLPGGAGKVPVGGTRTD